MDVYKSATLIFGTTTLVLAIALFQNNVSPQIADSNEKATPLPTPKVVRVAVAKTDLPGGEPLDRSDFDFLSVPEEFVIWESIRESNFDKFEGDLQARLRAGDFLIHSHVGPSMRSPLELLKRANNCYRSPSLIGVVCMNAPRTKVYFVLENEVRELLFNGWSQTKDGTTVTSNGGTLSFGDDRSVTVATCGENQIPMPRLEKSETESLLENAELVVRSDLIEHIFLKRPNGQFVVLKLDKRETKNGKMFVGPLSDLVERPATVGKYRDGGSVRAKSDRCEEVHIPSPLKTGPITYTSAFGVGSETLLAASAEEKREIREALKLAPKEKYVPPAFCGNATP